MEGLALLRDNGGDWQVNPYKDNWGSNHADGVVFLFADGTVRVLTFDTDPSIVDALLTPTGNEQVSLP